MVESGVLAGVTRSLMLELTDVSYRYAGYANPVLHDIDLRLDDGEIVGRLGAVGIGGPYVGEMPPGKHKHHPAVDRADAVEGLAGSRIDVAAGHSGAHGQGAERLRPDGG